MITKNEVNVTIALYIVQMLYNVELLTCSLSENVFNTARQLQQR